MDISQLALALGASLSAGLNLYITVFSLGLMQRLEWINLPDSMAIVANPWVMGTAALLFLVEFAADKVPYIDNTWDAVHTFIRVPAGALLAVSAFGDVPQHWLWIAALLGGVVSFTSHGAKATARLAVNASPEPFSNWFLSFVEDALSLTLLWLVSSHPYIAITLALLLLALFASIIYIFYQFFRSIFFRRKTPQPTA